MRSIHALLVIVVLAALGALAYFMVQGDELAPTQAVAPAASETDRGSTSSADLVGGTASDGEAEKPARVATEAPLENDLAAGSAGSPGSQGPRVHGRVVDRDRAPVAGATVYFAGADSMFTVPLDSSIFDRWTWVRRYETTTDENGEYEVEGPSPGTIRVAVRADGFAPYDRDKVPLPAGVSTEIDTIVLGPSAVITGYVLDSRSQGVAGAKLFIMPPKDPGHQISFGAGHTGALVAVSGSDGKFEVNRLGKGPWTLLVDASDHPYKYESGTAEYEGHEIHGIDFHLEDGFAVEGRIVGAPATRGALSVRASPGTGDAKDSGDALFEAVRSSDGGSEARVVDCKEDGTFVMRGLRVGQAYDLVAREESGTFPRSVSSAISVESTTRGLEIPYQVESALSFTVVDAKTRRPLNEFRVSSGFRWPIPQLDENDRMVREHPEGRVRFGNLRPKKDTDRATLWIKAVGYEDYEQENIYVALGQELDLGVIALNPVPIVRVVALDRETGDPIEGARVTLSEADPQTDGSFQFDIDLEMEDHDDGHVVGVSGSSKRGRTDEEGVAVLSSIEGENCVLEVSHKDYAPHASEPFYLVPGEQKEFVIEMGAGGAVTVTVLTEDGDPLPGASVEHRAPDSGVPAGFQSLVGGRGRNVTDAQGNVTFAQLAPGLHRFRPEEDGGGGVFVGGGDSGGEAMIMVRGGGPTPGQDPGWSEVEVAEGGAHTLVLTAPIQVQLTGRVREGGEDLVGATLRIRKQSDEPSPFAGMFGGGPKAMTDGDGRYLFEAVKAGDYVLTLSHPDRRMESEFEVTVGETDERFDVDLALSIIEGRIVDERGEGVSGLRVWAEQAREEGAQVTRVVRSVFVTTDGDDTVTSFMGPEGGREAFTDEDGHYVLRGVTPDIDLVVKAEGGSLQPGQSEKVRVAPDQVLGGVDLALMRAGKIALSAIRGDGSPAENLIVTASFEGDDTVGPQTGFIGAGGKTTLEGLRPGDWRLSFRSLGFGGGGDQPDIPERVVEVKYDETTDLTVNIP